MAKLTHRTNLLLSAHDYQMLSNLAQEKKQTMAALIRAAIRKVYCIKQKQQTNQVLEKLKSLGQQVDAKNINYKDLINMGRKY
jgi:hypothetical protein